MIEEIIAQIKAVIPKYTDDFSTNLTVSSLVRSGSTVTATTTTAHTLIANDKVLVNGALSPTLISSLTRINGYAIAITSAPHPLSSGDESVVISGATQGDYNGTKDLVWDSPSFRIATITTDGSTVTVTTFEDHGFLVNSNFIVEISGVKPFSYNQKVSLLTVPTSNSFTCAIVGTLEDGENAFGKLMSVKQSLNAYTFIFEVADTAVTPATGTIYQLSNYQDGYNGYKTVLSAPTTTSFTYSIATTPLSPAQGTIKAKINPTVACAPDLEAMVKIFTTQFKAQDSANWLYCVMENGNTSRDKSMTTDAVAQLGIGSSTRLVMIETFDVYTFIKTANSNYYTDAIQKSRATNLLAMSRTLVNFRPTSPFSDQSYTGLVLTGHGRFGTVGQHYIHRYSFETHNYISNQDRVSLPDSVPLRHVDVDIKNPDQDNYVAAQVSAQVDQEV